MIGRGAAVGLAVLAGGLVALQAPVNSLLGKRIGSLQAATASFVVGTIALVAATAIAGGGVRLGGLRGAPWYVFIGGLLGAVYVTSALVAVRSLGAGGLTAAVIAGQLGLSLVIDRLGLLGVAKQPLTVPRVVGVVLLAAGVYLVVRK
ncbi:MAG: DMT family transporter [Solirubrobacteraceae bacterium]